MTRLVLLALLCAAGCSLDRSGLRQPGARDGGGVDARPGDLDGGGTDAASPDDAGRTDASTGPADAGARDAGSRDAGPPDTGVDSGLPDAGLGFCDPAGGTLVLCVPCDGAALDLSPNAHSIDTDAVVAPGRVLTACRLGAGSRFIVADAPSLDVAQLTLELFVNADAIPTSGRAGLADRDGAFGLFIYPGGRVRCTAGGGAAAADGVISAGRWTHLACTNDGARTRLYVDGSFVAEDGAGAVVATSTPIRVGEDSPGGGDQLLGALDEIRLFSRVRTDTEIAAAAAR